MSGPAKEPAGLPDETLGGSANSIARETAQLRLAMEYAADVGRSEATALAALLKSCAVPRFAKEAFYSWQENQETVMHPSVRLARDAARCWGHMRYGFRLLVVLQDRVQVQGWAWDLRTGAYAETEGSFDKVVERIVDGQLILETVTGTSSALTGLVNKNGAKAERSALLKVLPPWFVEEGLAKALETHEAAESKQVADEMGKLLHGFEQVGVTAEQAYGYAGTAEGRVESNHVMILRGVLNAILDGTVDVGRFFTITDAPPSSKPLDAPVPRAKPAAKPKPTAKRKAKQKPKQTLEAAVVAHPGEGDGAELAAVLGERHQVDDPATPWDEDEEDGLSLLGDDLAE